MAEGAKILGSLVQPLRCWLCVEEAFSSGDPDAFFPLICLACLAVQSVLGINTCGSQEGNRIG